MEVKLMTTKTIILGLFFGPAAIAIVVFVVMGIINGIKSAKKKKDDKLLSVVSKYSLKYQGIVNLSLEYHMNPNIPDPYKATLMCNSKYQVNKADKEKTVMQIANTDERIKDLYSKLSHNRRFKSTFINKCKNVNETPESEIVRSGINKEKFIELEQRLCSSFVNSIREDTTIIITLHHATYGGGIRIFESNVSTNYSGLQNAYTEESRKEAQKLFSANERAKMSPKLQYQIFKRDDFRCVICGRSAKDGVQLHVDHIKPVSKGGRSEISNLRTLCDRCNLGKGASYDPNGLN